MRSNRLQQYSLTNGRGQNWTSIEDVTFTRTWCNTSMFPDNSSHSL
ncbi:hypothetical protein HanIR_Chr05g0248341 [Helianthus annuus]|nr:hypothetical protein HanIR_Chr05g0248341 [Helianthus annuus]